MRKVILLSFLAIFCLMGVTVTAQSPRLQLLEYFDNTSIPPFGAVANAHCDSLMDVNTDKIICLKYHVKWGSQENTDPMNLHNPAQVQARVNYYNLFADPWGIQDGGDTTDKRFNGSAVKFNQSYINHRDSTTSPFTIVASHSLSSALDSIITHTVITKTDTVSGPLVVHVVVMEKLIKFSTAPGESGDTIFRNVMKQMLPSATGTSLPVMNIGDSVVLNLKWKLANVYDLAQLAVVSFVQNNNTKEVHQAGYSAPEPFSGVAAIHSINEADIFPNPGAGNISIRLGSMINRGIIKLFSVTGENILQLNNLYGDNFSLDISNQPKGIYFLHISDGENNSIAITKIVLQ